MLRNLDNIAWNDLHTAYGPAGDVPGVIRQLASREDEEWDNALFTLEMGILHQDCDVTDATAAALPFLVEIATAPECPGRVYAMEFVGRAVRIAAEKLQVSSKEILMLSGRSPDEIREWEEYSRRMGVLTRDAAIQIANDILTLMADDDPMMRVFACWTTAGLLTPHTAGSEPETDTVAVRLRDRIEARIAEEPLDIISAGLIFAAGSLFEFGTIDKQDLDRFASRVDDRGIAVRLAIALINSRLPGPLGERHLAIFNAACRDLKTAEAALSFGAFGSDRTHNPMAKAFKEFDGGHTLTFPWVHDNLRETLAKSLTGTHKTTGDAVMPGLVDLLRQYDRRFVSTPVLEAIFPGLELPAGKAFRELTDHQQEALRILYGNLRFWIETSVHRHEPDQQHGHAREFLKGMPSDRAAMAAYVGIPAGQDTAIDLLVAAAFPWIETKSDLKKPRRCAQVTSLNLVGIATDEMIALLRCFPNLKELSLSGAETGESWARALIALKIQTLRLSELGPGHSFLNHLRQYRSLKSLSITRGTERLAEIVAESARIPKLDRLILLASRATDDDIPALSLLTNTRALHIGGARLTPEGENELRALLRGVEVSVRA